MKNKNKVIILFSLIIIVAIIIIALVFNRNDSKENNLTILDNNGEVIATLQNFENNGEYSDYIDVVMAEVKEILGDELNGNYFIETAFDKIAYDSCNNAYERIKIQNTPFASVVTSLDGRILCVVSHGNENINYAIQKTQPYSAFKPLSVYAPALEKGTASWASVYLDSPVKKVLSNSGEYVDWPANGTGKYTDTNVSISEGIKLSLNTTAVKCLMEMGVSESVDFLSENFGIDVEYEKETMALKGEEEILHNIGMGYLTAGVSPIDMAGYYQIFATGGYYIEPYSVLKITDESQKILYEVNPEKKQIVSSETAYIMNLLLQNTLTPGGTAEKAQYEDLLIGGKTGTGDGRVGNWFVGFTPEYCCSVWHGENSSNVCAETFSYLISGIEHDKSKEFPKCSTVTMKVFCEESGGKLTMNCDSMGTGYFPMNYVLKECNMHSK